MSSDINVPSLGESVTEATVAKWYKKVGESVKTDELLVELETDKVTLEVNAPCNGTIKEIKKETGSSVKVGELLAQIEPGEILSSPTPPPSASIASSAPIEAKTMPITKQVNNTEVILSPAAKKIAAENNVDPTKIQGTGKDERLTKADVVNYIENNETKAVSAKPIERVRMSKLRQKIAQRLKESQNTAAILTTFNEVDMTNILKLRNLYKENFEKKHGIKLGFMSFFVKASIAALKEIPTVNAEIEGDDLVYKNFYDIGVAVGTEQGLVVPVVRDADKMSFAEIEKTIAAYGKKAKDGKLKIEELLGGTFTISNGGVYGSLLSTPIINPPQAAILGMHKTQERPVAINGNIEIRPMMYLALSYDHRIIDGKEAVTFLVRIKEIIENPERIIFDL